MLYSYSREEYLLLAKVDASANGVSQAKGGSVWLSRSALVTPKLQAVITMVAIRVRLPPADTWAPRHNGMHSLLDVVALSAKSEKCDAEVMLLQIEATNQAHQR